MSPSAVEKDRCPVAWANTLLAEGMPSLAKVLPTKRWFRSKDKAIVHVAFSDWLLIDTGKREYLLLSVEIGCKETASEFYLLPLTADPVDAAQPAADSALFRLRQDENCFEYKEAVLYADFREWLFAKVVGQQAVSWQKGVMKSRCLAKELGEATPPLSTRLLGVEQSNTSFVINERWILKCIRKMESSVSPEVEMLEALNRHGFDHAPRLSGDISFHPEADAQTATLAVLQNFIAASGDGWSYLLQELKQGLSSFREEFSKISFREWQSKTHLMKHIGTLGSVTRKMHDTLALEREDVRFRPEEISETDRKKWADHFLALSHQVRESISEKTSTASGSRNQNLFGEFLQNYAPLADSVSLLRPLSHTSINKIRIHGDYHLGQVALNNNNWILFDFEGEPLLDIKARKQKHCALKDVAGLLRSFQYATAVAADQLGRSSAESETAFLAAFQSAARDFFLAGYFGEPHRTNESFLYKDPAENKRLLLFFELDKAVYELLYELNNRPDWIHVPASGILDLLKELSRT